MVVTFVGNANNYERWYQEQKTTSTGLQLGMASQTEHYNDQAKKFSTLETQLQEKLQKLEDDNRNLNTDLLKAEQKAAQAQADADSWKAVMTGFEQSVDNMQASLIETQTKLDQARAEGIKSQKELTQMTNELYVKIVQLKAVEADRRRLLEQKKELENRVTSTGTPAREVIPAPVPVTPVPDRTAIAATTTPSEADIKGLVAEVDKKLVTLTVGSADGVTEKMLFHITRGDRFMCDVVITNVDINRCAGVIGLMVQQPQVNDTASTQL